MNNKSITDKFEKFAEGKEIKSQEDFRRVFDEFMKIQKIMQKNRTLKDIRRVKSYPSKSSNSFMDKKQGAEFPTIVISGTEMQQYAKVIKEKINNWKRIFGDF